jgi:tRNA dimethylallyltransferase
VDVAAGPLDARIAERVDRMWAAGLVAETVSLVAAGLRSGRTAARALGYQQVLSYLAGDLPSSEAAAAETVRATRRFVRRQRSWFRRDPRIVWLDGESPDLVATALREVRDD